MVESNRGKGKKILVVEDDPDIRNFVVHILKANGFIVFESSMIDEAIKIFERENGDINLIFTDVVLPGKSGLFLADELSGKKHNIKILFTSGYIDDKSKVIISEVEKLNKAINHRPFNINSKPYQEFIQTHLKYIETLKKKYPVLDFDEERDFFKSKLAR